MPIPREEQQWRPATHLWSCERGVRWGAPPRSFAASSWPRRPSSPNRESALRCKGRRARWRSFRGALLPWQGRRPHRAKRARGHLPDFGRARVDRVSWDSLTGQGWGRIRVASFPPTYSGQYVVEMRLPVVRAGFREQRVVLGRVLSQLGLDAYSTTQCNATRVRSFRMWRRRRCRRHASQKLTPSSGINRQAIETPTRICRIFACYRDLPPASTSPRIKVDRVVLIVPSTFIGVVVRNVRAVLLIMIRLMVNVLVRDALLCERVGVLPLSHPPRCPQLQDRPTSSSNLLSMPVPGCASI